MVKKLTRRACWQKSSEWFGDGSLWRRRFVEQIGFVLLNFEVKLKKFRVHFNGELFGLGRRLVLDIQAHFRSAYPNNVCRPTLT